MIVRIVSSKSRNLSQLWGLIAQPKMDSQAWFLYFWKNLFMLYAMMIFFSWRFDPQNGSWKWSVYKGKMHDNYRHAFFGSALTIFESHFWGQIFNSNGFFSSSHRAWQDLSKEVRTKPMSPFWAELWPLKVDLSFEFLCRHHAESDMCMAKNLL